MMQQDKGFSVCACGHLQCLDDCKENTAEKGRPYELIAKHLGDNCFIALGLVRIHLPIQKSVPDVTCKSRHFPW